MLLAVSGAPAPAAETRDTPLAGRLLVATRVMGDPNFAQTVIYIVEHDAGGAFGLVVNRPLGEMPLAVLLERLGETDGPAEGSIRVMSGGPVQPEKSFILHSTDVIFAETKRIDDQVAITSHPDALKAIARGEGPRQALLIIGYSGWGPGQLEAEMAQGAWEIVPGDRGLLFDPDDEAKWRHALERFAIEL